MKAERTHEKFVSWVLNNGTRVNGTISDDWLDLHVWFEIAGYTIADEQVPHHTTALYFECHVTVEPVYGERLEALKGVAEQYGFRVADLLMRKRLEDAPERSRFDTFLTARSTDYLDLFMRMHALGKALRADDYIVWRWKIENTLLDERQPAL